MGSLVIAIALMSCADDESDPGSSGRQPSTTHAAAATSTSLAITEFDQFEPAGEVTLITTGVIGSKKWELQAYTSRTSRTCFRYMYPEKDGSPNIATCDRSVFVLDPLALLGSRGEQPGEAQLVGVAHPDVASVSVLPAGVGGSGSVSEELEYRGHRFRAVTITCDEHFEAIEARGIDGNVIGVVEGASIANLPLSD